jgi:tagatose 1,6-diphosphate aldolase
VDVLKVEFPVNAAFVEGSAVFAGTLVWTREQAIDAFRKADAAAGPPYVYLSAGVSTVQFLESLRLAIEARASFSGVLCGRATWQDGIAVFARDGEAAFVRWLETEGLRNIAAINECLRAASPWNRQHAAV